MVTSQDSHNPTDAQGEVELRGAATSKTSAHNYTAMDAVRDFVREKLYSQKEVDEFVEQARQEVLDELEEQCELEWYLRNEGYQDANPQEDGEANVARVVTDFISSKRTAPTEDGDAS